MTLERLLVGNDLVDLQDPWTLGGHLRERFVARVLGPAERVVLARAPAPATWLWACFAVKEAAYKALSRHGPPLALAHRRFEVAADLRSVRHGGARLAVEVTEGDGWVHAVAWDGPRAPRVAVRALAAGADAGLAARALLREALGGGPGLEIVRQPRAGSWDGRAPPRAERDGQPLPVEVSLSHDGGWVACAVVEPGAVAAPRGSVA